MATPEQLAHERRDRTGPPDPHGPMKSSKLVKYSLLNAPWTLIASFGQPLSNYVTIILLSNTYGLAAGGQFRLLLSIFGILTIFTLVDSGKIAVRYLVMQRTGVIRPLFASRLRWGLLGTVAGMITAYVLYRQGDSLALPVLVMALLLPLGKAADLYAQINQARSQFFLSAVYSVAKYGAATLLPVLCIVFDLGLAFFLCTYFIVLFGFNAYFLSLHPEAYEPAAPEAKQYVKQGVQLSASGVFPIVLEHADKFIISYFLGLEALALYTIGVSTGRLFLNFVKPTLSIYFPILVNHRPRPGFLLKTFALLTAIGIASAWAMDYYFVYVLGSDYRAAYPLAAVVVAGLGLFFVGTISYYSIVYHRDAQISVPTITNIATTVIVIAYLFAAVLWGGQYALLLCALSYPLRDFLNVGAIALLSNWVNADETPRTVP